MNAQRRRNRHTLGPTITLACAGMVAIVGLGTTAANAADVPTPSETSVTESTIAAVLAGETPIEVPSTTPTGTTLPVAP